MTTRIVLLALFGILLNLPATGQKVLLKEDLRADTITPEVGMNRKHFHHVFIGSSFFFGEAGGPGGAIKIPASWSSEFGIRYKRKFSHHYSVGYEIAFRKLRYAPSEWEMEGLNTSNALNRDNLLLYQGNLGLYQRINWQKRRGDFIGRFFDLGVYGSLNIASRRVYTFELLSGERVKVKESRLNYVRPLDYGVLARIGFGNFILKSTYRFSDHFTEDSGLDEFPRFSLGFELGLHPY